MTAFIQLPFVAGLFSLLLAAVSVVRKKPSAATWCFVAGMAALGIDSILTGLILQSSQQADAARWITAASIVESFIPVIWLGFSLTYSRSDAAASLKRWAPTLALVGILPVAFPVLYGEQLVQVVAAQSPESGWRLLTGPAARLLNAILLVTLVLILVNLEQTFRSAVGTMRWRIKYIVLAMLVIFGARVYVSSQAILFSAPDLALWGVESGALLIGCVFVTLAYVRTGFRDIDVQPSSAVLRSSVTVLVVGAYLFIVGVLAVVVRRFGGAEFFQLQAFVVLLGMAGLGVLLLSDRARQRLHQFVARHFRKAQHDSVQIWSTFSKNLARVTDERALSAASAKLISETFDVLSVTLWLLEEETGRLVIADSTARTISERTDGGDALSIGVGAALQATSTPFDLETVNEPWAAELRQLNVTKFPNGGNRWCVPLRAGTRTLGVIVLADRINGTPYTVEELELLRCMADQITSVLLNIRMAGEVARSRELEAFRTMSAFFVHDLKNAASSLNLMLKNLPVHFDDPEFRADALRGIGNTAERIDGLIARLSSLREQHDQVRVDTDLNQVVDATVARISAVPGLELVRTLRPVPSIKADREQLESVVTNLVLNARDAVNGTGRIEIRTEHRGSRVVLSVVDNGCGMSAAFIRDSLFRPFQSTKKKGIGIGLFQSRAIVLAHGGGLQVESEPGKGTAFHASFPVDGGQ